MNITLIRHTKVDVNQGICYGQTDVGLADSFNEEALKVKENLEDVCFDKVFSSHLSRCKRLAEFVFDMPVFYDERLMELNFGDWELQEWDKIKDPNFQHWMDEFIETKCTGGESFLDLHKRVKSFLHDLKKEAYKHVAIVAHGGVIRSFYSHLENTALKDAFKRHIEYGEVCKLSL